jgi:hypothetical protein
MNGEKYETEPQTVSDVAKMSNKDREALGEHIAKFTVPIIGATIDTGEPWLIGTGILLELLDHFFVMTVGHCVMGYEGSKDVHFGESNSPRIHTYDYSHIYMGQIQDWGYLEIDKSSALESITPGKQFLTKDDLQVLPPSDLKKLPKPVIMAGFPVAIAKNNIHPRFLRVIALPEGCKTDFAKNPYFQNGVNLWITDEYNDSDKELIATCKKSDTNFKGMSGGGVWIPKTKNSACLAALLGGGDEDIRDICLGVSVGSILKLISASEDSPDDLKKYILNEWDILTQNDKWDYS